MVTERAESVKAFGVVFRLFARSGADASPSDLRFRALN